METERAKEKKDKRTQKKNLNPSTDDAIIALDDETEGPSSSSPAAALPAAKVRRHRPSPFHKGSGKTKSRVKHNDDDEEDDSDIDDASDDGRQTAAASRSRRDNKKKVAYVDVTEDEEESDSDQSFVDDDDDDDDGWSP